MKQWLRLGLIIVCVMVFSVAGFHLYSTLSGRQQGQATYDDFAKKYTVRQPESSAPLQESPASSRAESQSSAVSSQPEKPKLKAPISINFQELLAANPDIQGWIYCEDTIINFPVVRGEDNTFYLKHLVDGTWNDYGTIFADATNRANFADGQTFLYGHNMGDGSMFSTLVNYADQSYFDAHPVFWLLTPEQDYQLRVFAGYVTYDGDPEVYRIFDKTGEELLQYALERVEKSDFNAGILPELGDKLVTLSTCEYSGNTTRYVVHCIMTS